MGKVIRVSQPVKRPGFRPFKLKGRLYWEFDTEYQVRMRVWTRFVVV